MRIAVDAMGGDHAPQAIIEGVMLAKKDFPDMNFLLFGDEAKIKPYVTDDSNVTIIHTDEKIESDDEPVKSIRRKKQASMVLAAKAVKDGQADAIFSAGNTGALMAAGLFIIGRIKQVERPGLMTTMPVFNSEDVTGFDFIDMGANADNKPEHLVTYATLASFYAKQVRGIEKPRVGLLNNGTESTKGSELTKSAYELLSKEPSIHFIGNVEARDVFDGIADVIVTDGFTGNAALKSIEGTAKGIMSVLKRSIMGGGIKEKAGALLLKSTFKEMQEKLDYSKNGGAVLFGVKSPVIKTHGSTGPEAVRNTIRQIHTMLEKDVVSQLIEHFENTDTGSMDKKDLND